jgi:hypothetical protein
MFRDAGAKFVTFSSQDAERYYNLAYEAEAEVRVKEMPNTAPQFLKMVKAIK